MALYIIGDGKAYRGGDCFFCFKKGGNVKKIICIIFVLFLATQFLANSQEVSETDFVAAKAQILYTYSALESNALQLSLLFEQGGKKMTAQEQALMVILRSDIELGMFVVKDILALYTLQSVQESTPAEACKLLIEASLDTSDFLNGLQERLEVRIAVVTDTQAKNIVSNSVSMIAKAKESVNILQKFMENL